LKVVFNEPSGFTRTFYEGLANLLTFLGLANIAHAINWGGDFGAFYVRFMGLRHISGLLVIAHPPGNVHYNLVIKRHYRTPDRYAWANLHIGTYYSSGRKCFVFYDSQHPWICWGLCGPTWTSLRDYLYYAMISAGVAASGALIWYAAGVLATVLLPVLLVF